MKLNDQGQRWCGRCEQWLDQSMFHKGSATQYCKPCRTEYFKERYDPEKARRRNFRTNYGMDDKVYDQLLAMQGGVCAICKRPPDDHPIGRNRTKNVVLTADHNHDTGALRGLLCYRCNFILGWCRDNPQSIDDIRQYMEDDGVIHLLKKLS